MDKDVLCDLYYNKTYTIKEISKILNVYRSCVNRNFKRYNLIKRSNSEAQKVCHGKPEKMIKYMKIIPKDVLYDLYYNKIMSHAKIAKFLNVNLCNVYTNFKRYNFVVRTPSDAQIERFKDPLERRKTGDAMKIALHLPGMHEKLSIIQQEVQNRPEIRMNKSKALTETNIKRFSQPGERQRHGEKIKKAYERPEVKENHRIAQNRPEVKEKKSNSLKISQNKPEAKLNQSKRTIKMWTNPIQRATIINGQQKANKNPEVKARKSKAQLIAQNKPETIEKRSQTMIKNWSNPEYAKKMFEFQNQCPNYQETKLTNILQEILPNEYKFTGDGSKPIGSKQPDWTNINGKMKLIDFYGTNPHTDPLLYKPEDKNNYGRLAKEIWEYDAKRLEFLRSQGYNVLIIWQRELKDIEKVKQKILEFNNGSINE